MSVRTRIAPSPTGDPHVGTAYVALFNYCLAKKHGGQFILRIEDTDQTRSTAESEQAILEALRWVGVEWDEGPDVGGPHGPYRQSERTAIYREHADMLLASGDAFRCFCSAERLAELRTQQREQKVSHPGYDGQCLGLADDEVQRLLADETPHVVRLVVPREGTCVVDDHLRGTIEIEWQQVDLQVLLKSDGMPTYHLANVVDDHLMGITHVLRGEEWISSAPKHLRLYEAFGWEAPQLCHLPLLRNPDKSKLSKRKNPTSILYYQRMGFLPEGLLNYLGRMAWSMPDESEKFTLDQMLEHFDLDRISLGGPVFDVTKLEWLNGLWIRELSEDQFADAVADWALNREFLKRIIPLVQPRVNTWTELEPLAGFFLRGLPDISADDLAVKKLEPDEVRRVLAWTIWRFEGLAAWNLEGIEQVLRGTAEMMELKLRDYLSPFFVAVSGSQSSTPLFDTLVVLGRDMTLARLRHALETLGGLSKKETKRWRRAFDDALRDAG